MDIERLKTDYPRVWTRGNERHAFPLFGFECGPGWGAIIEWISAELERLAKEYDLEFAVDQVKEKFGTLRFYYSVYPGARWGERRCTWPVLLAKYLMRPVARAGTWLDNRRIYIGMRRRPEWKKNPLSMLNALMGQDRSLNPLAAFYRLGFWCRGTKVATFDGKTRHPRVPAFGWRSAGETTRNLSRDVHAEISRVVNAGEAMSGHTCETCGMPGKRGSTETGWVVTLCPVHMEEKKAGVVPPYNGGTDE